MNARQKQQTTAEARSDLTSDPDYPRRQQVSIPFDLEAPGHERSRSSQVEDEEPRPVDAPAPQLAAASVRGKPRHGR